MSDTGIQDIGSDAALLRVRGGAALAEHNDVDEYTITRGNPVGQDEVPKPPGEGWWLLSASVYRGTGVLRENTVAFIWVRKREETKCRI